MALAICNTLLTSNCFLAIAVSSALPFLALLSLLAKNKSLNICVWANTDSVFFNPSPNFLLPSSISSASHLAFFSLSICLNLSSVPCSSPPIISALSNADCLSFLAASSAINFWSLALFFATCSSINFWSISFCLLISPNFSRYLIDSSIWSFSMLLRP